ncbi:hypothetical protein Fcan01_27455 [Folsomia candida]|uniref:Uncharacterized protein n=1 Tax=Folsomia candida TaxID=158441 RepID=A0A226D0J6_FOLCA|nr:hypothetical protein Fcan01_27455 [Folsomia candida]
MSSKRGNKQPKSSLTLGDTRAFYKLLFGRLDESGMIDLNTTLLEFKRLYSPAQGVTGLLREEYEKRRREHPSVSEFRQWAIFHDYHTENVEHDSDTEEDGGMPYLDTMLDPVTGGRIPAGAQRTELIGSKSTQTEIVEPTPIPKTTSMETTMDSNIGVADIAVNTSSDDPLVTGVLEAAADNQVGLNDLRNGAYETWLATNLPVEMSRNDGFKTASVAAFHGGFDLVFNVKNYCILKWCEAVKEQQITIVNESITDNVLTTLMQYNRIKAYTTTDRKARLRRFLESKEALDILVDFLTYFGPLYPFKETFQIMFKHADEKHSD